LNGSIPTELGNLTKLTRLSLYRNQFTGPIPSSLGQLVNLQYLLLHHNKLTGQIPSSLGNLSNLTFLYLEFNKLNGSIPTSLGNLVKLQELNLFMNQLNGTIPSSVGQLVNLEFIDLRYNKGLNGTFTAQCLTTSGAIPKVWIDNTGVTICGCAAASTPPATFPPPGTPDACLATGPALTLSKRILAFSQAIGSFKYTCNTDSYNNPYSDCLNSMAKICNTTDSSFDKANCHTGVNMMFGNMSPYWQNVRKECGQWSWAENGQTFVGNSASSNCATANSNLRTNAFYIHNGIRVPVDLGLTESTNVGLWSKVTA